MILVGSQKASPRTRRLGLPFLNLDVSPWISSDGSKSVIGMSSRTEPVQALTGTALSPKIPDRTRIANDALILLIYHLLSDLSFDRPNSMLSLGRILDIGKTLGRDIDPSP